MSMSFMTMVRTKVIVNQPFAQTCEVLSGEYGKIFELA